MIARFLAALLTWPLLVAPPASAEGSYRLTPVELTENVWIVEGKRENFSNLNGGNILNTAFVVTGDGVVVIDTGPSRQYGEELREAIAAVTDQPVTHVLLTHHHPDHVFGNQAFAPDTLYSLSGTRDLLAEQGDAFADNMYRMVGHWMKGTEVVLPQQILEPGYLEVGEHRFQLLEMTGHTGADLVILDESSGVLFASDMVFHNRALTTPQTPGLEQWRSELEALEALSFRYVVPGHGPVSESLAPFHQTRDYLVWLQTTLQESARQGLTASEVMALPIPDRFSEVAEARYELIRTTTHLYPSYEKAALAEL